MPAAPQKLPWYGWLLAPFVLLFLMPLAVIWFVVEHIFKFFPESQPCLHDFTGTPHQRALVAKRRALYRKMFLFRRFSRALLVSRRRKYLRKTLCAQQGHQFEYADEVPNIIVYQCRFCKTQRCERAAA